MQYVNDPVTESEREQEEESVCVSKEKRDYLLCHRFIMCAM